MGLLVSVKDKVGVLQGHAPGKGGMPLAVIIWPDGTFTHEQLSDLKTLEMPRKLMRYAKRVMKERDKQNKHTGKETSAN